MCLIEERKNVPLEQMAIFRSQTSFDHRSPNAIDFMILLEKKQWKELKQIAHESQLIADGSTPQHLHYSGPFIDYY